MALRIATGLAGLCLVSALACADTSTPMASPAASPLGASVHQRIEQDLARREYHASVTDRGLQAPNRAQGFRTWFTPAGVNVVDRDSADALVRLELEAWGRGRRLTPAGDGEVHPTDARVEIIRPGLVEWYENRPEGLEHGFTVAKRPAGRGPLRLRLAVHGANAQGEGDRLDLVAGERRLHYSKLKVWDAAGTPMAAQMRAQRGSIELTVDDSDAQYPLTIDPLLSSLQPDAQLEANQAGGGFGLSVAGTGDVNGDGYADVIVGAPSFDQGQNTTAGAVFVYYGSVNGVVLDNSTPLAGTKAHGYLGHSVAGAGDVNGDGYADVIVGAPYLNADKGAAFIYYGSANGLVANNPTPLTNTQPAVAFFGYSVAGAGDVNGDGYADVVVGAARFVQGQITGAVYAYYGSANGLAVNNPTLLAGTQPGAHFGYSVAGAGDVNGDGYADIVVGTYNFDQGQSIDAGAAFVYYGSANGLIANNPTSLAGLQAHGYFGWSVAGAGDVNGDGYADVIVGAVDFDQGQNTDAGAAFVYRGGPNGLITTNSTLLAGMQAGARLGWSVAGAGDVNGDRYDDILVGAADYTSCQSKEGAAFLYLGGPGPFTTTHVQRLKMGQANGNFGVGVAGAGDVNGDGVDDVIIGASAYDAGQSDEGAAFVYHGNDRIFANAFQLSFVLVDPCP